MASIIHRIKELPWWIPWTASGGIGLILAFAPNIVSKHMSTEISLVGVFLLLVSAGGFIFHLFGSIGEKEPSDFIDPNLDLKELAKLLMDNLPACKKMPRDNYDEKRVEAAANEMRKQGRLGNIIFYGHAGHMGPLAEIPRKYWDKGRIHNTLVTTPVNGVITTQRIFSGSSIAPNRSYSGIQVPYAKAIKLWPQIKGKKT